ncbi:MAG: GNAT family N-acetyltransferase [Bacteroidales bacterium]|nr:GNAT family N-acetyltransferase [Bacteroidales bacterium]
MEKLIENCYLRAFEPEDYKITHKWRTDPEMTKLMTGNVFFVSSEREKKWLEEKIFDDRREIYWAICDSETHEMVGMTSLRDIDYRNRKAFIGGMTIGKEHWGKHYAFYATFLALKYAFLELGLNRVSTDYIAEHKVSRHLLVDKLGLSEEGVFRQELYKAGKYHNIVKVAILKDEFLTKFGIEV